MQNARLQSLLCLVLLTSTAFALDENSLRLSPEIQRGDIEQPRGIWPLLGVGLGVMDSGQNARTGGVPAHLKLIESYYFEGAPWVADLGLGVHNEVLTQEGGGNDNITSIYSELAARYQFTNRWQMGAIWNTLVDNPRRYHSNNDNLATFVGGQVLKEFTYDNKYLVRAGGRAMTSLGLRGESISTLMAELEVSFGEHHATSLVETPVRALPENPIELNLDGPQVDRSIAPHLANNAMKTVNPEHDHTQFKSDSVHITTTSRTYLKHVARALADNKELFGTVEVFGYADQRGTEKYNRALSAKRAKAVAKSLIVAGIGKQQILIIPRGDHNPITHATTPAALAKNRRVELRFKDVKDRTALQNIIDAIQR